MNAWLRRAVVGGTAALGCLASPVTADACVCVGYPGYTAEQVRYDVETDLDRAAAVFTGEVISADTLVAVVRVDKVWKGDVGSEVRMRHARQNADGTVAYSSCQFTFSTGKKYVVFGTRVSPDLMSAGHCGSTGPIEFSARTIEIQLPGHRCMDQAWPGLAGSVAARKPGGAPDLVTFTKRLREGIRRGRIRCSIRIWTRPHVKIGGRYRMDDGHIVVDSITPIGLEEVTYDLARESGFDSVDDLLGVAKHGRGDKVYLIRFHYLPPGAWDTPR